MKHTSIPNTEVPKSRTRYKKLSELARELGVIVEGHFHDARVDALVCGEVFLKLAYLNLMETTENCKNLHIRIANTQAKIRALKQQLKRYD
jgi:DNA polymerase III epsilon subunit-like protein